MAILTKSATAARNLMYEASLSALTKKVAEMTHYNNHGGAREAIAKHFGYKKLEKVFRSINDLHHLKGHLDHRLAEIRNEYTEQMLDCIDKDHGLEVFKRINNSL